MALSKCSDCGGSVSTLADACPHCGCPKTTSVAVYKICDHCKGEGKCLSEGIVNKYSCSLCSYNYSGSEIKSVMLCRFCEGAGKTVASYNTTNNF